MLILLVAALSFIGGGTIVILFEIYKISSFFDGIREGLLQWLPGAGG